MVLLCPLARSATANSMLAATDLAEVLGSAVALHLLFGLDLFWAVLITAADVLLLLALQGLGMRLIEAVVLTLVATIGVCFALEIFVLPQTRPDFAEMGRALVSPRLDDWEMVVVAVGIIGATVMPHNLYLHSALVQTRRIGRDKASVDSALRFNTLDSVVALSVAFLVNAAILTLAALVFHGQTSAMGLDGHVHTFNKDTDWIKEAYQTLSPLMGPAAASMLFAVALLASGQSSTITGTMAGQVVMEGFMRWRVRPWLRRLLTRLVAILPAIFIIGLRRDSSITDLLVLSQVVLALYLPLAMIPLLCFTGSRKLMGRHVNGWFLTVAAWASCLIITVLDIVSLPKVLEDAWRVIVGA
jgi:manganese transport protein